MSKAIIINGIIIEEYADGNDCTVPVFSDIDNIHAPAIVYWSKQQTYKLKGFSKLKSYTLSQNQEDLIVRKCEEIVHNIGYRGVCRFDIRITNDNYYFLEINSVISIRSEGTSFQALKEKGINILEKSLKVYLNNIK